MKSSVFSLQLSVSAVIALLVSATAAAQSIDVRVSSRSIGEDDEVQVTFAFSGRGEGQLPDFKPDWNVAGRSQSVNTRIINGDFYQERAETVVLTPTRSGMLTIGAARLVQDGNVLATSEPINVAVRGVAAMKPSDAAKEENLAQDNVIFLPELARDVVYVGEPFVATFSLYVREGATVSRPDVSELPLPEAIQREDVLKGEIKQDPEGTKQLFGRSYARVPIFREIWKVLRPATLTIPSLKATIDLPGRDLFSGGRRFRLKSPPMSLEVRAVPTEGRPAGYREGTIGKFTVSASLQADEDHGRALLEVVIEGRGNLAIVDAPHIAGVTGAQVKPLPSEDKDQILTDEKGVSGRRVFQYLLTPERAGTVFVPAVELAFFDPEGGKFDTAKSQPLTWTAQGAAESTRKSAVGTPGVSDARPDLHPIEGESTLESKNPIPLHARPWYLALLGLPLAAFLAVEAREALRRRRHATSGRVRVRRAFATAQKRLRDAEKGAAETDAFGEIAKALRTYVEDRHGLVLTGLRNDQMRTSLGGLGYPDPAVEALIAELESCDFARFARGGHGGSELKSALERTLAILTEMEKQGGA